MKVLLARAEEWKKMRRENGSVSFSSGGGGVVAVLVLSRSRVVFLCFFRHTTHPAEGCMGGGWLTDSAHGRNQQALSRNLKPFPLGVGGLGPGLLQWRPRHRVALYKASEVGERRNRHGRFTFIPHSIRSLSSSLLRPLKLKSPVSSMSGRGERAAGNAWL